jgi:hypothetical protein
LQSESRPRMIPRVFTDPLVPLYGKSYPAGGMAALGVENVRGE